SGLHHGGCLPTTKGMNAPAKPTEFADAPVWELSDLYASREDPRIAVDLERASVLVERMNGWQGRLAVLSGVELGRALDEVIGLYEQAADVMGGLGAYAFLAASTNREDTAAQAFEADVREKLTVIATPTVWLTLEINALDEAAVETALTAHA